MEKALERSEQKDLTILPVARVVVCSLFGSSYDYLSPPTTDLQLGDVVEVPFGKRQLTGVVWQTNVTSQVPREKLKAVAKVHQIRFCPAQINFLTQVADYWMGSLGAVVKMALAAPGALNRSNEVAFYQLTNKTAARLGKREKLVISCLATASTKLRKTELCQASGTTSATLARLEAKGLISKSYHVPKVVAAPQMPAVVFRAEQQQAYQEISKHITANQKILLYGATGSGKTEVCYQVVRDLVEQGKQVLLLMPEIALANEATRQIKSRIGEHKVIEWHSGVSLATKCRSWLEVAKGLPAVIVGARSALFLPFKNLGLVVVEEEHDRSFKQESGVLYHARDAAIMLTACYKSSLLLISATPSLETIYQVQKSNYQLVKINSQPNKLTRPSKVTTIDMSQQQLDSQTWVSPLLRQALVANIRRGQQSLLFLNRRGYAPLTFCRTCGYKFLCRRCSSSLVSHCSKLGNLDLVCHFCNLRKSLPTSCPQCHQNNFCFVGPGCERLAEEVANLLPEARILVLTSDKMRSLKEIKKNLDLIHAGKVDVIIGTQVLAKGHNFPQLTLVGLIDPDTSKQGGDLRGYERIYQLLTQVSGRAGRFDLASQVYLQTFAPQDQFIQQVVERDFSGFLQTELKLRYSTSMPPFSRLVALIASARDEASFREVAFKLHETKPAAEELEIWGPAAALVKKISGRYRWRYLLRAPLNFPIQDVIKQWLTAAQVDQVRSVRLVVDVDPYSFS